MAEHSVHASMQDATDSVGDEVVLTVRGSRPQQDLNSS